MINYKIFKLLPEYGTNTYVVWDEKSKEAFIIDPAAPSNNPVKFIERKSLKPKFIINTHGHLDHIGGDDFLRKIFKIPLAIFYKDSNMLTDSELNLSVFSQKDIVLQPADILIGKDNFNFKIGNYQSEIIHTPGHTKGSICILINKLLFSGDTLFYESIGRTDLPTGNFNELVSSIKNKLFKLPDEIVVLPGHGYTTTIGDEKVGNPFVGMLADNSYLN